MVAIFLNSMIFIALFFYMENSAIASPIRLESTSTRETAKEWKKYSHLFPAAPAEAGPVHAEPESAPTALDLPSGSSFADDEWDTHFHAFPEAHAPEPISNAPESAPVAPELSSGSSIAADEWDDHAHAFLDAPEIEPIHALPESAPVESEVSSEASGSAAGWEKYTHIFPTGLETTSVTDSMADAEATGVNVPVGFNEHAHVFPKAHEFSSADTELIHHHQGDSFRSHLLEEVDNAAAQHIPAHTLPHDHGFGRYPHGAVPHPLQEEKAAPAAAGPVAKPVEKTSLSAFGGKYFRLYVQSDTLPLEGVECAEVSYINQRYNGFDFLVSRIRSGKLEEFRGTFERSSTKPFLQSQFVLDLVGLASVPLSVIGTGPIVHGKYEFAILATSDLKTIAIDARNRRKFVSHYAKPVLEFLKREFHVEQSGFIDLSSDEKCFSKLPGSTPFFGTY